MAEDSQVKALLISGACNTVSKCTAWFDCNGTNTALAYALQNLIAIVNVQEKVVVQTLRAHPSRINGLCYVHSEALGHVIVSYSSDGTFAMHCSENPLHSWLQLHSQQLLAGVPIVSADVCLLPGGSGCLVVFSCADATVHLLKVDRAACEPLQNWKMHSTQIASDVHLCALDNNDSDDTMVCLFLGCTDAKIHVYTTMVGKVEAGGDVMHAAGVLIGHQDWVRCMDSVQTAQGLLLASGSQDNKIRLWKITRLTDEAVAAKIMATQVSEAADEDASDDDEAVAAGHDDPDELEIHLILQEGSQRFAILFEALLVAHEDHVTRVEWNDTNASGLQLMSTSMDRNIMIWAADKHTGIWLPETRMGDIGGNLGGCVGGNLLGFVYGCYSPTKQQILAMGYGGSFHLWTSKVAATNEDGSVDMEWQPEPFLTGHFSSVNDVAWGITGDYIVTASSDQTSRLFASVRRPESTRWAELSRPQIHGYDLNCLAMSPSIPHRLYSGGDEKVIRVYDATSAVVEGLKSLAGIETIETAPIERVHVAVLPDLGLSNKAADMMTSEERELLSQRGTRMVDWSDLPLEGQLVDYTLWPEVRKLFGHKYEMMAMDVSGDGMLLASASKARDEPAARLRVWDTRTFACISELSGHQNTCVSLRFSPNNQFLASAGRDRQLCIFGVGDNGAWQPLLCVQKAHKRIIWGCAWSSDGQLLATGSRDGELKIWRVGADGRSCACVCSVDHKDAITAVDFLHQRGAQHGAGHVLAVGFEKGDVRLYRLEAAEAAAERVLHDLICEVPDTLAHGATVKRLRCCQVSRDDRYQLASASEDATVRIFEFSLP